MAYDPGEDRYFFGSVRKGQIWVQSSRPGSKPELWQEGLWAVMGMKVSDGHLWAAVVSTAELEKYEVNREGCSAVLKFDLKSRKLLRRFELSGGHWFGDLIVVGRDRVFVSDSQVPHIYEIHKGELRLFEDLSEELANIQGLTLVNDYLFISDYRTGIYRLNVRNHNLAAIPVSDGLIPKGIDGLYYHRGRLLGIHNGVQPNRVVSYLLSPSLDAILSYEILDQGLEDMDEPTLGVLIDNQLVYVVNSPWARYDKEGRFNSDGLVPTLLRALPLD